MKVIYFVIVLFVSFVLFTACGGEECTGANCNEPADEISVTDEEVFDNENSDSDILVEDTETNDDVTDDVIDSEPSEDEENPDEDQGVTANCEKLLDLEGNWIRIDWEGYEFTITIVPKKTDCEVNVNWTKGFNGIQTWYGFELPLTILSDSRYMTLKKDEDYLIREETDIDGSFIQAWTFKKIQ